MVVFNGKLLIHQRLRKFFVGIILELRKGGIAKLRQQAEADLKEVPLLESHQVESGEIPMKNGGSCYMFSELY